MPKDYREVDTPMAENLFSDPNLLSELLDDLDAYEEVAKKNDFNKYQSEHGDRMKVEKHKPFDVDEEAPEVEIEKKAAAKEQPFIKNEDIYNLYSDLATLKDLTDEDELLEWIGVNFSSPTKKKDQDAQSFPN